VRTHTHTYIHTYIQPYILISGLSRTQYTHTHTHTHTYIPAGKKPAADRSMARKKVVIAPDSSDPMYVFSSAQRPAAELASSKARTVRATHKHTHTHTHTHTNGARRP
jgi:hypothetical protein